MSDYYYAVNDDGIIAKSDDFDKVKDTALCYLLTSGQQSVRLWRHDEYRGEFAGQTKETSLYPLGQRDLMNKIIEDVDDLRTILIRISDEVRTNNILHLAPIGAICVHLKDRVRVTELKKLVTHINELVKDDNIPAFEKGMLEEIRNRWAILFEY